MVKSWKLRNGNIRKVLVYDRNIEILLNICIRICIYIKRNIDIFKLICKMLI